MADRHPPGNDDLTAILRHLRLQHANGQSPSAVTQQQIELLLTRIAALTDVLRGGGPPTESTRASARLLLADLAMVTAHLRGHTNALDERLTRALDEARDALTRSATDAGPGA